MRYACLLFALIVLSGCLDMDTRPRPSSQLAEIELLNIDPTAAMNEEVSVRVRTKIYNGCWSNLNVTMIQHDSNHIGLVAVGTVEPGNVCPTVIVQEDTVIKFKAPRVGEYYFRANYAPFPILRDTLEVE